MCVKTTLCSLSFAGANPRIFCHGKIQLYELWETIRDRSGDGKFARVGRWRRTSVERANGGGGIDS